jgi:hypothetical protein
MTMPHSPLEDKILREIQEHHVIMRPRWRHMVRVLAIAILASVIALYLLFHTSFILYILHRDGFLLLPSFGSSGFGHFLASFPWILLAIGLALIVMLGVFVGRQTRAYRFPLIYSLLGVAIVIVGVSVIIEQTPFHSELTDYSTSKNTIILAPLYKGYTKNEPDQTYIGILTQVESKQCTLLNRNLKYVTILYSESTRVQKGLSLKVDTAVMVIGKMANGKVSAEAIQKLPKNFGNEVRKEIQEEQQESTKEMEREVHKGEETLPTSGVQ